MLLSVVFLAVTTFLGKDSEVLYHISLVFLISCFLLSILARKVEMNYADVTITIVGSLILGLVNILL